jgi:hypothetical protein
MSFWQLWAITMLGLTVLDELCFRAWCRWAWWPL